MNEPIYHLQKYTGIDSRHTCPHCGHKREWTLYVDANNKPIAPEVGKCNREKCGGHMTPSDYFKQNPTGIPDFSTWKQPEPVKVVPVSYLPTSLLAPDTHRAKNNLFRFMAKEFGNIEANRVFDTYRVGTSKHWRNHDGLAASFPQIDELGRLRRIKVIAYNPNTGKRMKKNDTLHVWIEKRKAYVADILPTDKVWWADKPVLNNYDLNLVQCLFGEHLIKDASRVGIVESEKSALICSILMPDITWVSTGGCNGCKWTELAVFKPLVGKRVVLYPDSGMFAKWGKKAAVLQNGGVDVTVSRACEGL
ncbi:MAG: DUF6371 domain-containing protein, partial [Bacteroidaceae bacterium]